jgi:thiamine transport system ATP-binding protein
MSLRLDGVALRAGAFALRDVSLDLPPGSYGVLLGPSGSGKSLLLQAVAGLCALDAGRILVAGREVGALPPEARGVGLVFQRDTLFPHLDVRGNLEFGLRAHGVAPAERQRRVEELVELLGLSEIARRPVATLSGGEGQRVAIARSVAPRPRVLLLDEPLGMVDAHGRRELREVLRRVHRELGLTTLHVTHDRAEALALGDVCAVLIGGALVQAGPSAEVFARPAGPAVARVLGGD